MYVDAAACHSGNMCCLRPNAPQVTRSHRRIERDEIGLQSQDWPEQKRAFDVGALL